MNKYNHQEIEKKWQKVWAETELYKTGEDKEKPKYYILDMFPYPSGAGLHVGHPKGYIATDIFSRLKMMQGHNVLHPMGWDAFGLPAENFALKNKIHPRVATEQNIKMFKEQLLKLGFTYDWEREINTTDPEFYKWTQWAFIKMFERGLAYESYEPINWCPSCKTGLANEDLEDGKCERCGSDIEQKPMRQWVLKITDYADRMLNDLEKLPYWEESIKEMQKNWIGKSEGAEVQFSINNYELPIKIFTTRPDTLFGATYLVLAPEHPLIKNLELRIENLAEVKDYIEKTKKKTELERTDLNKEKTGVEAKGIKAINPVNNEEIPIFIADYVLSGYGTGAIMAVPAHDERDFEFAKKYNLEIKPVVMPDSQTYAWNNSEYKKIPDKSDSRYNVIISGIAKSLAQSPTSNDGVNFNSDFLDGLDTAEAKNKIIAWLEEKNIGKKMVNYKIKDWVFSRQRYWGEPIPIIHCEKCGNVAVPEKDLPVLLPEVEQYEPSGTGESPLAKIADWVNTTCPKCGGPAKRETNTMPQWAGSSWYYLRYIDPHNANALIDKKKDKYWSPVDFYVGGAEHATRHLIYARFWHKFLFDIGAVNYEEPFTRLQHVGLILAEDGRKMSKRWGNVINPDEIVEQYGADAMRVYEMFMGPFNQPCAWSTNSLIGARRFLEKVYNLKRGTRNVKQKSEIERLIHKTIKKVTEDIEAFKFNTAISALMILVNALEKEDKLSASSFELLVKILSPFAPHLCEEIWSQLGHKESIFKESWPKYDPELARDEKIELVLQVNGKVRDRVEVDAEISEAEAIKLARESEQIKKWTQNKEIIKEVFVKGKLVNIVVK
ncbi:MAG: leucine--tRNA ligase [Patescibacteria group bacterium]|nr:leucine--tRNA ligase [Patescibacteria group bacterium]